MEPFTSYIIIPELRLILTNLQGKIQISDVIRLTIDFIQDESYDPTYDLLMDYRGSIALGFKIDLLEYIEFLKRTIHLRHKVRVGMLTNTPNQRFLIAVYKPMARLLKMVVEDFQDIDRCLLWMGYGEKEQTLITDSLKQIKRSTQDID